MTRKASLIGFLLCGGLAAVHAFAAGPPSFAVIPGISDPADTDLVNALWVGGLGCPTAARVTPATTPFTNAACPTGDATDIYHEGLLLIKTGPTSNNALSGATLFGVQGIKLTELGYDIRAGSVCDAVAPRFDIWTTTGKYYKLVCDSSHPELTPVMTVGQGWTRLRWKPTGGVSGVNVTTGLVEKISDPILNILIIFDEGQDVAPNSGIAVLDNIDVNGVLVGRR